MKKGFGNLYWILNEILVRRIFNLMASGEGFLTEEQRQKLKIASQNAEILSSSPKSPPSLLSSEHHVKVTAVGRAPAAVHSKNVRRSHSGKFGRVKKGESIRKFLVDC